MVDVTDATFEAEVVERSKTVPVVVDLWAEWCEPCKQLGPILEKVIAATNGQVVLAKVDVEASPAVSQAFKVQSIPAVYAMKDGEIVDGFTGAQGEAEVQAFVDKLLPSAELSEIDQLVAAGDEASLVKALEIQVDHPGAVVALAEARSTTSLRRIAILGLGAGLLWGSGFSMRTESLLYAATTTAAGTASVRPIRRRP